MLGGKFLQLGGKTAAQFMIIFAGRKQ